MARNDGDDPIVGMGKVLLVLTIAAAAIFGLVVVIMDSLNYMPQYIFFD